MKVFIVKNCLDNNGKPLNKKYLEIGLPDYLSRDIENLLSAEKEKHCLHLDCFQDELYGSINAAYWDGDITEEQAAYLRKKYLSM